ncbi:MAG: twin-arginine translocase subunit TatC [Candidatus Eisenbacteria bacterium]|nr:twin-arginine translocase subunit TatC [Candidatus Eisenbacteria bacterium]
MRTPAWMRRWRPGGAASEMSFLDHLDELRSVLISCATVLLLLAVGAWFVSGYVLDFLVAHTVGSAQFIKPFEAFGTRIKLALLMAVIVGLPFFAYRIWGFIVPGLMPNEKRIVLPLVFWSTLLFLLGVAFSAALLSPTMLRIMLSFGTELIEADIAVAPLFDFFVKMAIACGLLFQVPVVVAVLSHFGVVTPAFLTSKWRHAIVIILVIAAVVTPGDGPSQVVLAIPVILLYFISIQISKAIWRGKQTAAEGEETEAGEGPDEASRDAEPQEGPPEDDGPDDGRSGDGGAHGSGPDAGDADAGGPKAADTDAGGPDDEPPGGAPAEDDQPEPQRPSEGRRQTSSRREDPPRPLHPPDQDYSI